MAHVHRRSKKSLRSDWFNVGMNACLQSQDKPAHLWMAIDGAAKGNPGPAGIGVVVVGSDGVTVNEISESVGFATNNVAEYLGLIRALREAVNLGAKSVRIQTDSELIQRQFTGVYKVASGSLKVLHAKAREIASSLERVEVIHVPRSQNSRADMLANRGVILSSASTRNSPLDLPRTSAGDPGDRRS